MSDGMTTLWTRLGICMELSPAEMDSLVYGNRAERETALQQIFSQGRVKISGDSYVPADTMDAYNMRYGTDYPQSELDLETDMVDERTIQTNPEKATPQKDRNRGDAR